MRRLLMAAVLLTLSCDVPPEEEPAPPLTEAQMAAIPLIDFTAKPSYLPNNVISLTFDTGPT